MSTAPTRTAKSVYAIAADNLNNGGDTTVLQPNVSPFGWTTGDAASVKDILGYVQTAIDAANSAQANAQYVQQAYTSIQQINTDINNNINIIYTQIDSANEFLNNVKQYSDQITQYWHDTIAAKEYVESTYEGIKTLRDEVLTYAMQAVYKYNDNGDIEGNSRSIDVSLGTVQTLSLTQPTTSITFNTFTDPVNTCRQITLTLKQGTGANKVSWPSNIKWNNGRTPVLSYLKDKLDVVTVLTHDSGANWLGFYNGGWFDA